MGSNATGSVVSFVIIRCSRFPCARRRAAIFFVILNYTQSLNRGQWLAECGSPRGLPAGSRGFHEEYLLHEVYPACVQHVTQLLSSGAAGYNLVQGLTQQGYFFFHVFTSLYKIIKLRNKFSAN